jgi:hypothetical protein
VIDAAAGVEQPSMLQADTAAETAAPASPG